MKQKDSIKKKKQKQQKEHVLLYKLLYSFMTMLVYMVGRNIPLYGIDIDAYSNVNVDAQSILLQAISGNMKNCSIFIIGLWPYMLDGGELWGISWDTRLRKCGRHLVRRDGM